MAVAGQQTAQGRDEIDRHRFLLSLHGAEGHRRTQIEHEPRCYVPVFNVLSNIGRVQSRRDVPVDVADIVLRLVLAQVREVHTASHTCQAAKLLAAG